MFRFASLWVWCFLASSALAAPSWPEALEDLKKAATVGDRAQVSEKVAELYQQFASQEKIKGQLLKWGADLLEIFNTQKGLNDFERAKSLSELEPELALELLQRSLESEPNHPKVLAQMADIHLRKRDVSRARAVVQKLLADYPLWESTYLYQLRVLSADPDLTQLAELAEGKTLPFEDLQRLASLLHAVYGVAQAETRPRPPKEGVAAAVDQFPYWPEVTYLAVQTTEVPEKHEWIAKFLSQCKGEAGGAALPKYPSAICQRADQVKELGPVKPEAP